MKVMERYPMIIPVGVALLGFGAGEMLISDHALEHFFQAAGRASTTTLELTGAVGVGVIGDWLARRKRIAASEQAPH